MRARQVAHYHGERIVVGVRAEALSPMPTEAPADIVHGRVLYIEHHGHESLAFIDIGAYGVQVDETAGGSPSARSGSRLSKVAQVFRRADRSDRPDDGDGSATEQAGGRVDTMVLEPRPRHYRTRSEVAVRLSPYPNLRAGDQISVAVRVDQLHFFDAYGRRIDVGWHH